MFRFRTIGYVCPNLKGNCQSARQHEIIYITGKDEPTCNICQTKLTITALRKWNTRILFWFVLILINGYLYLPAIVNKILPPSIVGVNFSEPVTRITEKNAIVIITLNITGNLDQAKTIDYHTLPHTATANVDFTMTSGQLFIHPNQKEVTITIPIIPDRDVMEPDELFYVELLNVEGKPKHTVIIEEEGFDKDLLEKSDAIVASLSLLSADIANDMATIAALENYLKSSLNPDNSILERYDVAIENIIKAREAYLLLFTKADKLDPVIVQASIKNRLAVLEREGYETQLKSTKVMELQLLKFITNRIPLTDRWMKELRDIMEVKNSQDFRNI